MDASADGRQFDSFSASNLVFFFGYRGLREVSVRCLRVRARKGRSGAAVAALSREVVEYLRAMGPGWQPRIDERAEAAPRGRGSEGGRRAAGSLRTGKPGAANDVCGVVPRLGKARAIS